MKTLFLLLLGALVLCVPAFARAENCETGATPCAAYAEADAVFLGKVTRINPESTTLREAIDGHDQMAYIAVERTYKGSVTKRVTLRQLKGKQAPTFVLRSRYLFYANYDKATRSWWVKPCGRTLMTDYAQDDLRYLDGLPKSAGRTRVAGIFTRYDPDPETGFFAESTPERLAGMRLKIIGEGREYEAVTDASGMYEIYDLPPGRYTLHPHIPAGLRFMLAMHYGSLAEAKAKARNLSFELQAGGCSGVSILLTTDAPPKRDAPATVGKTNDN